MKLEIRERIEKIQKGEVPEGFQKQGTKIIPIDWAQNVLGGLITYTKGFAFKSSDYISHGIRIIRVSDTTYDSVKEENAIYIDEDRFENYRDYELLTDDLVVSTVGSKPPMYDSMVGKIIKIPEKISGSLLNQNAVRLRLKDQGKFNLIYYQLKTKRYVDYIKKIFRGNANQASITLEDLFNFIIIFPQNNKESDKITEILSTWDKAIELQEKLIEEKKEFKRGLMQKLLVGKLRFKEHVKNPNLQEAKRYSTLPEEWGIKKASSIFSNISKKNNRNEQLLSATQNNGVIPRDMLDGDVMSPSGDTKSYKLVEEGDFVISLRSFQGGIEYSSYRGIISPAYTVIKNKIPICKDFYRYIFKSKLFIDRLASSVIGIRDGKQISYGDFSFMFLPYPELKEQEKIAFTLKNLDYNIKLLKLELNQLKEQKRGLMQLLLTGIVRVEVN